jgi:peptidoglycan/xylan/chitin deacetylase (PgdA/CDA1 family)
VLATIVADHLLVMAVSLWPRSSWLGPNLRRLPAAAAARGEVAITIDDGPDPEVTPQVLDLLNAAGVRATFFCVGEQALKHPALCRRIVADGHAIENHGQRHPTLASLMGPAGWRREVDQGASTIEALTGRRPVFYRAVAGLRNPFLDPVLHGLGLRLASWTRRGFDTRTRDPQRVLQRLRNGLDAGDVLLLHDGHAARTEDGQPVIVAVLPRLLHELHARGLHPVTLTEAHTACDPTRRDHLQHP